MVDRMNSSFPNRWSSSYPNWKQQQQLFLSIFCFKLQNKTKHEAEWAAIIPLQTHAVEMTSGWRRCDVMTSHRRQATSCARWVRWPHYSKTETSYIFITFLPRISKITDISKQLFWDQRKYFEISLVWYEFRLWEATVLSCCPVNQRTVYIKGRGTFHYIYPNMLKYWNTWKPSISIPMNYTWNALSRKKKEKNNVFMLLQIRRGNGIILKKDSLFCRRKN